MHILQTKDLHYIQGIRQKTIHTWYVNSDWIPTMRRTTMVKWKEIYNKSIDNHYFLKNVHGQCNSWKPNRSISIKKNVHVLKLQILERTRVYKIIYYFLTYCCYLRRWSRVRSSTKGSSRHLGWARIVRITNFSFTQPFEVFTFETSYRTRSISRLSPFVSFSTNKNSVTNRSDYFRIACIS